MAGILRRLPQKRRQAAETAPVTDADQAKAAQAVHGAPTGTDILLVWDRSKKAACRECRDQRVIPVPLCFVYKFVRRVDRKYGSYSMRDHTISIKISKYTLDSIQFPSLLQTCRILALAHNIYSTSRGRKIAFRRSLNLMHEDWSRQFYIDQFIKLMMRIYLCTFPWRL